MEFNQTIQQKTFQSAHEKAMLNLMYTSSWVGMHQLRFFKAYGLSPQQYNVLRILRGRFPEKASIQSIQERMIDRKSNASRLVEKLKQRGWVARYECPNDRRQVEVEISETGLALLGKIDIHQTELLSVTGALTEKDAEMLNSLLDKLRSLNNHSLIQINKLKFL